MDSVVRFISDSFFFFINRLKSILLQFQIVESPEGEISFKTESLSGMTPQMIEQHTKLLAKKDIIKNSSVIISPIKKLVKPRALPTKPVAKPLAEPVEKPIEKPIEKPVTKPADKPVSKPVSKPATKPVAKLAPKSPKKKASSLPLPKLTIPKKIASVQKENVPGKLHNYVCKL